MDLRFSSKREALTEWQMFAAADAKCQMVRTGQMRSLSMAYGGRGTIDPETSGTTDECWGSPGLGLLEL